MNESNGLEGMEELAASGTPAQGEQNEGKDSQDFQEPITFEEIKEKTEKYVLGTYNRLPVSFFFGQGELVYDNEHREYIDFLCGLGVTSLGHGEADLVEALREQGERIWHTSNLYFNEQQALLAEALVANSFPAKVFFSNSGTEANEAAFKLARSYGQKAKSGASEILALTGSFHGRSTASMSITGNEKIHNGFGPLIEGVTHLPPNDVESLEKAIIERGDRICALFLEPVLGEGGVLPLTNEFLREARRLTQEYKILLIVDEVQCGIGRSGKLFAYEHAGIQPDVLTLAKALGGGFPIGATLIRDGLAKYLGPGQHGSTFGGNHLAARIGYETLKIIIGRELLNHINAVSEFMLRRLRVFGEKSSVIEEVRGLGLMIGVNLTKDGSALVPTCLEKGLLINHTAGNVIRLLPPLNISLEKAAEGLDILEEEINKFAGDV